MVEFLYVLLLLVLANLGERYRPAWYVVLLLLAATNAGLVLLGAGLLLIPARFLQGPPSPFFVPRVGVVLLATGLVAFLPLLAGVRRTLCALLPLEPDRPVHTTALVYAVYLVGVTAAQFAADVSTQLFRSGVQVTQALLWVQEGFFTAAGLLGVGFPVRRSLAEARRRLGLTRPTGGHLRLALLTVVGLQAFDFAVSLTWSAVDPVSFQRLQELNRSLFAPLLNPVGALTLGLAAGVGEEILFRGALQPRFGLWLTAALFAIAHTQYALSPALLEVFVIGLVLGLVRNRTSTTTAVLVHALYNTLNVLLWPLWPGSS